MTGEAAARDRRLLYAAGFMRSIATGTAGVLIGLHLARLRLDAAAIGGIVACGLAGAAVATAAVMLIGDRLRRRAWLMLLACTSGTGAAVVAWASSPWLLACGAALGMVNGMGRDRGAALVIEQAALPATASDAERTRVFAWFGVLQDSGHALGGIAAALPALFALLLPIDGVTAFRIVMSLPVVLAAASLVTYVLLSDGVDSEAPRPHARRLSDRSRPIVGRISALFALDALGGGFVSTALVAYFLHERFGVTELALGPLFFAARVANALSHLAAAWLAARIGLVNTMVFTHVPSSLLLLTIPYAPTFPVAAALFVLREALVEMDVPTRQSYVMAVVRPGERTVVSAATNLVRLAGWAVGPAIAGVAMQGAALAAPLFAGAAVKILYDALLYRSFRGLRPPEERRLRGRAQTVTAEVGRVDGSS